MADYDQDTREQRDAAYERLVERARYLHDTGRHVHVEPDVLNREIRLLADKAFADRISNGPGHWVADPYIANVWGYVDVELQAADADVGLVYYRHLADFECDETWERNVSYDRREKV